MSGALDLARLDPRTRIDKQLAGFLADRLPPAAPSDTAGRGAPDRGVPERVAPDRGAHDHRAADRGAADRGAVDRADPEGGDPAGILATLGLLGVPGDGADGSGPDGPGPDSRSAGAGPTHDQDLVRPVADLLLRGGKRLRPALCYWGWRGAGGEDCDEVVAAATALELLQGCALIHDDVMDGSHLRRGGPTVHRALARTHQARGWRGDPDQFGIAAAVAAGDLCLIWADEMLRGCGLPAASLTRAAPVYDALRAETVRGQYLDLFFQAEGALRVEDALRAAVFKTAASTTVGPLQFGGALAGADDALMAAYLAYGRPLGVAFQLRDDLLGAFGDPSATGKPSGDDLRDGKCTVLLAEARRRADARGRALIDGLLRADGDAAAGELREVIEAGGARAHVTRMVAELGREAVRSIDAAPLADDAVRDVLRTFAVTVTTVER